MERFRVFGSPSRSLSLILVLASLGALLGCPSNLPPERNVLIMATPTLLDFGTTGTALSFEVWKNNTSLTLPPFTVTADKNWIAIDPSGGQSTGPEDRAQFNVTIDRAQLTDGLNRGSITIQAPGVTSTTLDVKALSGVDASTEIGPAGGIVEGPEDSCLEIAADELTEEVGFALRVPAEAELRATLAANVPYAGALRVDAWRVLVSSGADATDGSFEMTVCLPLNAPLGPGTLLDVYAAGSIPGEWMLLDNQATVNEDGTTASFITNQIGVFMVRITDGFTIPSVNPFTPVKASKQGYLPEEGYGLHKVDGGGSGPVPIILIHGAQSEYETTQQGGLVYPGKVYARWDNFIDWAKGPDALAGTSDDNIDLANKFQLWWFLHDTTLPIGYEPQAFAPAVEDNAQQLAGAIDARRVEGVFPGADQQFIIMAHGRGGLVARAFMERVDWAGPQVMIAISLGAPHHGLCYGVPDWAFYTAKTHFSLPVSNDLLPAHNMLAGMNQVLVPWYEAGGADAAWDNFDNAALATEYGFGLPTKQFQFTTVGPTSVVTQHYLTTNDAGWPTDANLKDRDMELPALYGSARAVGQTLWDLNHAADSNQFMRKFLLYAGYITEPAGPTAAAAFWSWDAFDNDTLQANAAVMARFVSEGTPIPLHAANDGYVPIQSALYLRGTATEPVFVPAYRAGIVPEAKTPIELDAAAIASRLRVTSSHAFVLSDYTNLDLVQGLLSDDDATNDAVLFDNYLRSNIEITLLSVPTASFYIASRSGGTVTINTSYSQDNGTLLWPATELQYRVNWGDGEVSAWSLDPPTTHIYIGDAEYTIKLQVLDEDGMMATTTRTVVVTGSSGGEDLPAIVVDVPEGDFTLGPRLTYSTYIELPPHGVYLDEYQIGKYEVTNGEYAEVLNFALALGYLQNAAGDPYAGGDVCAHGQILLKLTEPSCQILFDGAQFSTKTRDGYDMDDHPVVRVTWYGAVAYTNWLNEKYGLEPCYDLSTWEHILPIPSGFRLPTEAEWERAAAWDPSESPRCHWEYGFQSDSISPTQCNYNSRNPLALSLDPRTTPAGFYNGINRGTINSLSPVGACDMTGNVWEWCHDWLGPYPLSPINPTGRISGDTRIIRGGGWNSDEMNCRTSQRASLEPDATDKAVGFRVARTTVYTKK